MRILVVEDEAKAAELLQRGLVEEGHTVDVVGDGAVAREQLLGIPYDVVVLDWSLPGADGVSVLRAWRERGIRTPVLMLTARGTVGERVTSLRAGADDHLVKPFAFVELVARLEALHRRAGHQKPRQLGDVMLDDRRRALVKGDQEASLTAREYTLMEDLTAHLDDVRTRSQLLSAVWGQDFDGAPNVVDVYIGYLRHKLAALDAQGVDILTVRGVGYRLRVSQGHAS